MSSSTISTAVSIGLIVVGVLLILGEFTIPWILGSLGIVLVVLGVLVLLKTLPGGTLVGVVALVVGVLMLQDIIPYPTGISKPSGQVLTILNVVAGAVLVALGIGRLSSAKQ